MGHQATAVLFLKAEESSVPLLLSQQDPRSGGGAGCPGMRMASDGLRGEPGCPGPVPQPRA